MGLSFSAIDMIVDTSGEYWLLENNPNGQWGYVENATGQPIGIADGPSGQGPRTKAPPAQTRLILGTFVALDAVTLALRPGEVVALMGPSGSGEVIHAAAADAASCLIATDRVVTMRDGIWSPPTTT